MVFHIDTHLKIVCNPLVESMFIDSFVFYFKKALITFLLFYIISNRVTAYNDVNPIFFSIFIVQEGWHTGIVLETASIPDSLWQGINQFQHHNYLDIGWGDEAFYQEPGINVILALRAILFPTKSVIRIHGFRTDPVLYYESYATLFELKLTQEQYYTLIRFIANSFIRKEDGKIILSTLQESYKNYFLSKRYYHLFRTCNTWVCLALKESSVPVRSSGILTRRQLIRQLNRLDRSVIRRIH